jgi:hypothetical protein
MISKMTWSACDVTIWWHWVDWHCHDCFVHMNTWAASYVRTSCICHVHTCIVIVYMPWRSYVVHTIRPSIIDRHRSSHRPCDYALYILWTYLEKPTFLEINTRQFLYIKNKWRDAQNHENFFSRETFFSLVLDADSMVVTKTGTIDETYDRMFILTLNFNRINMRKVKP